LQSLTSARRSHENRIVDEAARTSRDPGLELISAQYALDKAEMEADEAMIRVADARARVKRAQAEVALAQKRREGDV
jgi:hypothetical protein